MYSKIDKLHVFNMKNIYIFIPMCNYHPGNISSNPESLFVPFLCL